MIMVMHPWLNQIIVVILGKYPCKKLLAFEQFPARVVSFNGDDTKVSERFL